LLQESLLAMPDPSFDTIDIASYRDGMARLGSAVSIVTTKMNGKAFGFTASAVCSVSDTPPTLLVCINRASSSFPAFEAARYFNVNTLMPGQEHIADAFGGRTPTSDRFVFGDWQDGVMQMPILRHASVCFECELTNAVDQATHRVLFGRVIKITENHEKATLLYSMRRYLADRTAEPIHRHDGS
jgi:flavin reductase